MVGLWTEALAHQIHPEVVEYTLSARTTATTIEQLEHQVMTPPVVAGTCLSTDQ